MSVTAIVLSGAGALTRCRLKEFVLPAENPPQPLAAAMVNVMGAVVALPPVVALSATHAGSLAVAVSMVKFVPPVAAEVTEIVCALPGAYVDPLRVQVRAIVVGEATNGVAAAVTVMFAVDVTSLVPPALKVMADVLEPEVAPAHPAATLTE